MAHCSPSLSFAATCCLTKFALVVGLTLVHHLYGRWRKDFEADRNMRPASYYRWWNEVPTVLMIAIVFLAVLKPF